MDRHETLLELAQRHVAEAELRVMRQKALVAALAQRGRDTAQAKELLITFEKLLEAMRDHVAVESGHLQIRRAVNNTSPGSSKDL